MSYQHKSGSKKRKEKNRRDAESRKGQQTFDNFLVKTTPSTSTSTSTANPVIPESDVEIEIEREENVAAESPFLNDSVNIIEVETENEDQKEDHTIDKEKVMEPNETAKTTPHSYDIGTKESLNFSQKDITEAILSDSPKLPKVFPLDFQGNSFPASALKSTLLNGETVDRDWLSWSPSKNSLYCFPCRLFSKLPLASRSMLACPEGYSGNVHSWKRVHDKLNPHGKSVAHTACYLEWRNLESRLVKNDTAIDTALSKSIKKEVDRWRLILKRILHVILFLGERGLPLRGDSNLIGDPRNGNFLGILELIAQYDPILNDHLAKVKQSQTEKKRLQVHYLSADIQNEFILCCAYKVIQVIVNEISEAKYFSVIVDSTPDSSHVEQTVFILRYVTPYVEAGKTVYKVNERFLKFVDCNKKTGDAIADLIKLSLQEHHIALENCRGQGYDNASNMSGIYKGAQSRILAENPLALYSPCACHSLNLCGEEAAQKCVEAVTFFGIVQKCYNVFSSSPQRWEILQQSIGSSLHSHSQTRWSARVDSVRPFAAHLPGLKVALSRIKELNLTPQTLTEVKGIEKYLNKFECLLMSSIWLKVLSEINDWNVVLQSRQATIDVEVVNLQHLIENLTKLRTQWSAIVEECKLVANNIGISQELPKGRKKTKLLADKSLEKQNDSPEENFKINVFYVLIDSVVGSLTQRFKAVNIINDLFKFFWQYPEMKDDELKDSVKAWSEMYSVDVPEDELRSEMFHLKKIQPANFPTNLKLKPLQLLNTLSNQKLTTIFPNVVIALRIFCTLPVTVAEAERSFSLLNRIKNCLRSTMGQERLTSLGVLAIESDLAKDLDFDDVINDFAIKKARKVWL